MTIGGNRKFLTEIGNHIPSESPPIKSLRKYTNTNVGVGIGIPRGKTYWQMRGHSFHDSKSDYVLPVMFICET